MSDPAAPLSPRARARLAFERDWAAHEGQKGTAIRRRFGITSARYYQLLNQVLDSPAALAYDPLTVRRLRRRRDERQRRRTARALGEGPGR
ncbi:MAG: DUF3263 domain-containing protein [Actinomycetota bacterium]|nr:DUF3263 domain-containing protein [Actinomycetota bacterium]